MPPPGLIALVLRFQRLNSEEDGKLSDQSCCGGPVNSVQRFRCGFLEAIHFRSRMLGNGYR